VLAVGLTGGIGSGKSSVAALLRSRGAVLVDADMLARQVVQPGGPAYEQLVGRFGREVLDTDGRVDRERLAGIVFADERARADLEAITHPPIGAAMMRARDEHLGTPDVVVFDVPLLAALHREALSLDVVVVVDCPPDVVIDRLTRIRGMQRVDAEARIAAQVTREERLVIADVVVDNSGSLEELASRVDEIWADFATRASTIA
jgi:dephospho-CoA kinase